LESKALGAFLDFVEALFLVQHHVTCLRKSLHPTLLFHSTAACEKTEKKVRGTAEGNGKGTNPVIFLVLGGQNTPLPRPLGHAWVPGPGRPPVGKRKQLRRLRDAFTPRSLL
jgi:hypothetical protein